MAILLNPSPITLSQARTTILRPSGNQNVTEQRAAADDHLRDTINGLNTMRMWSWMHNYTQVTCNTTGELNLPTSIGIHKIYAVEIPGLRPLKSMDMRAYLRDNPRGEALGGQFIYIPFMAGETGKLLVKDAPSADTLMNVYYIRLMTLPNTDTATFSDIPVSVMTYILDESRARYAADSGGDPSYWSTKAEEGLRALKIDDSKKPDAIARLVPPGWGYEYNE